MQFDLLFLLAYGGRYLIQAEGTGANWECRLSLPIEGLIYNWRTKLVGLVICQAIFFMVRVVMLISMFGQWIEGEACRPNKLDLLPKELAAKNCLVSKLIE